MKSIIKLKDDARRHEQKEEWEKAIQIYLQVLQIGEEGESEVELPLYNRVGDLAVRLGRHKDAVRYYEQAADRYAEAGLYNNAIALCNKALRYGPDRPDVLRKLGQFSASQGFVSDARRYYLAYAEQKFGAGDVDEALTALSDFASIVDDAEVREMLGRQLHTHGRSNEAVGELRRAFAMYEQEGNSERAEALRNEIIGIDPGAFRLPMPSFEDALIQPTDRVAVEAPALSEIEIGGFGENDSADAMEGLESTALSGGDDGLDFGTVQLADFESGAAHADAEDRENASFGGIEGLETTTLDFDTVSPDMVEDPGLEREESSFDLSTLDEPESPPLPMLHDPTESAVPTEIEDDGTYDDDGYSVDELPLLGEEERAAGLALPQEEDEGEDTTFELPAFDVEDTTFDLPAPGGDDRFDLTVTDAETPTSFTMPMFEEDEAPADDLTTDFALPDLGPDTSTFDLPDFDAGTDDDALDLPSLPAFTGFEDDLTLPSEEAGVSDEDVEVDAAVAEESMAAGEAVEVEDVLAEAASAEDARAEMAAEAVTEPAPPEPEPASPEPEPAPPAPATPARAKTPPGTAPPAPAPPARTPSGASGGEGYVDLFALVSDDEEETTRFHVQENAPTGDEDRDFAELLNQFKAKVSEHLPAEDAAAHYDLGLAFKEMGLIDEAIAEFQIALRAGHMRLKVHEEIGHAFLLKEQYNIAEKVLRRALEMKYDDELEMLGVYYHLGRAYEGMGKRDQARDAYERVLGLDINFQDVNERLARL